MKTPLLSLKIILTLLTAFSISLVSAQVTIPAANTNNGSVNDPFGTWYGYERSAMIYTAAQIGRTGTISSIGFYLNSKTVAAADATNVRIYMKMRTTTFTGVSKYSAETIGATLVFGPTTITAATLTVGAWNTIALATPFNYTGDNLEIIVETNATGTGNELSTAKQFRYETQGTNEYYQNWNADTNPPTGNGNLSKSRPNVQLTFNAAACSTPTAQPTLLNLTPTLNSVAGTFTAASPAPTNYLVVANTTGAKPTPVDGTAYTVGSAVLGGTNVIVDNDGNTTFPATGLFPSTTYYFYVFSYNNTGCTGGPHYNRTSPLSKSATTLSPSYCSPTSNYPRGLYINKVEFVGALSDPPPNSSTFNTTGFEDFTGLAVKAVQAQGEGINIKASAVGTEIGRGRWKAWIDWNKNGTFEQNPSEEVYNTGGSVGPSSTFGFVIPTNAIPGNYRIRFRINNGLDYYDSPYFIDETFGFNYSPCDNFELFTPDPYIANFGDTEDYLFTVVAKCNALIVNPIDGQHCGDGTVDLKVSASGGVTEFRWYTAAIGGTYKISPVVGTSTTYTTDILTATTNYYVTAWNGTCESQVRTLVIAKIIPTPVVAFTKSIPDLCGESGILQLTAGGDKEMVYLIDEDFEDVTTLGKFENKNNDANSAAVKLNTSWKNQMSTLKPDTNVWLPAISSGFGPNRFALAYSDSKAPNYSTTTVENSLLLTTAVSSANFLNLKLKLKMYYSRLLDDGVDPPGIDEYVNIELSTDGGVTYPNIIESFKKDVGIGTRFKELGELGPYDLSAYLNQPNLKIRIRHRSYSGPDGYTADGVAIDNVELYGERPLNTSFNYNTAVIDAYTNILCTSAYAYVSGTPVATIYLKPSETQLQNNATFTIPVSATLSNGCSATGSIIINNNSKLSNAGTTEWATNNWKPFVEGISSPPTASNCVIIKTPITLGVATSGLAKNLTVKNSDDLTSQGNLTVEGNLTVTDFVKNITGDASKFTVSSDANLKQITETSINTGNITVKRESPMKKNDYTYWSSPVSGQNLYDFSTGTSTTRFYYYRESDDKFYNDTFNASTVFNPTQGYAIMAPSAYTGLQTFTGNFVGVPNNGTKKTDNTTLQFQLKLSSDVPGADKGYNLIGNPYPSNIDFDKLFTENGGSMADQNSTAGKIFRLAYFWTNVNPNRQGSTNGTGSSYSGNAYAVYNGTGGVPATSETNSPIGYTPTSIIKVGQGFIVKARPFQNNTTLIFNNTIRTTAATKFFSKGSTSEKDRYWLKLISPALDVNTILIGYVPGATNNFEWDYDAPLLSVGSDSFYSILNNETLGIQGRVYPLNPQDIVQLGTKHFEEGNYTISLGDREGIFAESQSIYLKDNLSNTVTNLSDGNYTFAAKAGVTDGRFEIIYEPKVLLGTRSNNKGELIIYREDSDFVIKSPKVMVDIEVFDISGKLIATLKPNSKHAVFETSSVLSGIYVVRIKNIHGEISTRKISK